MNESAEATFPAFEAVTDMGKIRLSVGHVGAFAFAEIELNGASLRVELQPETCAAAADAFSHTRANVQIMLGDLARARLAGSG